MINISGINSIEKAYTVDVPLLSTENKNVRFRVNSMLNQHYIQTILVKIWKCMLDVVYKKDVNTKLIKNATINLEAYLMFFPLFEKAMGEFYCNEYYIAKPEIYGLKTINFSRFSFDLISLCGEKLLEITNDEFQTFLRKLFQTLTFTQNSRIKLISLSDINSPWLSQDNPGHEPSSKSLNLSIPLSSSKLISKCVEGRKDNKDELHEDNQIYSVSMHYDRIQKRLREKVAKIKLIEERKRKIKPFIIPQHLVQNQRVKGEKPSFDLNVLNSTINHDRSYVTRRRQKIDHSKDYFSLTARRKFPINLSTEISTISIKKIAADPSINTLKSPKYYPQTSKRCHTKTSSFSFQARRIKNLKNSSLKTRFKISQKPKFQKLFHFSKLSDPQKHLKMPSKPTKPKKPMIGAQSLHKSPPYTKLDFDLLTFQKYHPEFP
ncbi:unnamed protein product [Moneuplotes crassus]|uniref:Uncharacterized protein n=1 Tax=Euplotes crassus TaxID=5936 RepID=A0AAD1X5I6_EUPCR|nr:unnamed protein product [Moneuplotes crassus]